MSAEGSDEELLPPLGGLSWPRVVVVVLAFAFLAGAIGHWIGHAGPPGEGSVDAGFYQDMIHHHDQAISMALYEQENGSDPVVVGFANEILRRQEYEIGVMSSKLDQWGYTTSPGETAMEWMGMRTPVAQMPGLATDDQMARLKAAKGAEADALFLELMSNHHRGGVHMADYAYRHADSSSVRELAQRMAWVQATEINEFRDTAARNHLPVSIEPAQPTVPNPSGIAE